MICAIAERGDLTFRIDNRFFGECVDRSRGSQTHGHDSLFDISGAERAQHVVAASGTH
jgi:hypothetical protein